MDQVLLRYLRERNGRRWSSPSARCAPMGIVRCSAELPWCAHGQNQAAEADHRRGGVESDLVGVAHVCLSLLPLANGRRTGGGVEGVWVHVPFPSLVRTANALLPFLGCVPSLTRATAVRALFRMGGSAAMTGPMAHETQPARIISGSPPPGDGRSARPARLRSTKGPRRSAPAGRRAGSGGHGPCQARRRRCPPRTGRCCRGR